MMTSQATSETAATAVMAMTDSISMADDRAWPADAVSHSIDGAAAGCPCVSSPEWSGLQARALPSGAQRSQALRYGGSCRQRFCAACGVWAQCVSRAGSRRRSCGTKALASSVAATSRAVMPRS